MSKSIRICILAAGLLSASGLLFANANFQAATSPAGAPSVSASPAAVSSASPEEADRAVQKSGQRKIYGAPGNRPIENADEEENSQFKYSSTVRTLARKTGLSKEAVYWIFNLINFAVLAAGLVWVVRKMLPNGFAPRTAEIQKGIEEARKASAEAGARLSEIEARLARLDTEIAEIRTASEADFSAEEQRIKADAERDAKQVIASAEQEIAAATRVAQRDLKVFVAGLAVDLAEKKINVDDATDHELVRGFATQLGKDGR
jgi:F0F1-type ATP synthase membrane subunit b/b'